MAVWRQGTALTLRGCWGVLSSPRVSLLPSLALASQQLVVHVLQDLAVGLVLRGVAIQRALHRDGGQDRGQGQRQHSGDRSGEAILRLSFSNHRV